MEVMERKPLVGAARDRIIRLNAQLAGTLDFEARLPKQLPISDVERSTLMGAVAICKSLLEGKSA